MSGSSSGFSSDETAVAIAFGAASAAIVYASMRAGQTIFFPGEAPQLAAWTAHAAFTWRALIALYAGGILTFAFRFAFLARRTVFERAVRALPTVLLVAAAILVAQATFTP